MSRVVAARHRKHLALRLAFLSQAPEERDESTLQELVAWLMSCCNSVFDGVSNEFLGNLIQTATLLTVERGNAVYIEKQDKDHRAFVVLSGRLSAYSTTRNKLGLGESGGVKQIRSSPPIFRRSGYRTSRGFDFLRSRTADLDEIRRVSSMEPGILQRSSSEPLGLDKAGCLTLSSSIVDDPGEDQRKSSPLLRRRNRSTLPCQLRERSSSPQRAMSPLAKTEDIDKPVGNYLGHIVEGQVFGEMALFTPKAKRDMTVLADESVVRLLVIEADDFYTAAHAFKREDLHEKTSFLESIDIFKDWDWSLKFHLAHNVEWERCSFDRYVVRAGDPATHVYLIVSGQAVLEIPASVEVSSLPALPSNKLLQTKQRTRVKELARLQPTSVFGLGEMLANMEAYGMALRACEQLTLLRISRQKLRASIEKYHPETLDYIRKIVKQHEEYHNTRIYAIDSANRIHKGGRELAKVAASGKKRPGRFLPKLEAPGSAGYAEIPPNPITTPSPSQRYLQSSVSAENRVYSAPSSPRLIRRRGTTLSASSQLLGEDGLLSSRSLPDIVDFMKQISTRPVSVSSPVMLRRSAGTARVSQRLVDDVFDLPSCPTARHSSPLGAKLRGP